MALILHKLKYLIMPALVMSLSNLATVMRFARSSMIETLNQDYVRTARAKGLSEKVVIYKHALKNSMIPVITIFGQSIPNLFGGAYITEKVFGWPGMGHQSRSADFIHRKRTRLDDEGGRRSRRLRRV